MRKFWKAKRMLKKLLDGCPEKYAKDILKIGKILREWTDGSKNIEETESVFVEPFAAAHRLCRFFPCVEFKNED